MKSLRSRARAFQNLNHQLLHLVRRKVCRRGFDRHGALAEGFDFKTVGRQFVGDRLIGDLLLGLQLDDNRHQEPLHFHFLLLPQPHVAVEEHAFVRGMLVNNPKAVGVDRDDEALLHLSQGRRSRGNSRGVCIGASSVVADSAGGHSMANRRIRGES